MDKSTLKSSMFICKTAIWVISCVVVLASSTFLPKQCSKKHIYMDTQTIKVYFARPVNTRCGSSGFLSWRRCRKYVVAKEYLRTYTTSTAYKLTCCSGTIAVNGTTCFKEIMTVLATSMTTVHFTSEEIPSINPTKKSDEKIRISYKSFSHKNNKSNLSSSTPIPYSKPTSSTIHRMCIFTAICTACVIVSFASSVILAWITRRTTRGDTYVTSTELQNSSATHSYEALKRYAALKD